MTTTWKCLISRFMEDVNTRQRPCFLFHSWTLINSFILTLEKNNIVNIWRFERDGINAIKFKAALLHFFRWRFPVAIAVVVAYSSLTPTVCTHLFWTEGILSCRWDPCGSSQWVSSPRDVIPYVYPRILHERKPKQKLEKLDILWNHPHNMQNANLNTTQHRRTLGKFWVFKARYNTYSKLCKKQWPSCPL